MDSDDLKKPICAALNNFKGEVNTVEKPTCRRGDVSPIRSGGVYRKVGTPRHFDPLKSIVEMPTCRSADV